VAYFFFVMKEVIKLLYNERVYKFQKKKKEEQMDKSFFIFIVIGMGFFYVVTNFVGGIQKEDEVYQNNGYKQEHQYDQYITTDSIDRVILNLNGADEKTQVNAWNNSSLKSEFIDLYPDFDTMKLFIKERTRGEEFQEKMLHYIDGVESKFFSGAIDSEEAKRQLSMLK